MLWHRADFLSREELSDNTDRLKSIDKKRKRQKKKTESEGLLGCIQNSLRRQHETCAPEEIHQPAGLRRTAAGLGVRLSLFNQ